MKLSVPTNWDPRLLEFFEENPIHNVYGMLDRDVWGGGKPSFILPRVDRQIVEKHVRRLRDRGIAFTYLLNAPCFNNMEFDRETHRSLIDHIRWIRDMGADSVAVSVPYLIELIKTQFPELNVRVSVIAVVDSVTKAEFYESLGVSEITLDFNINREFKKLGEIRRAVHCDLMLIVNDFCLFRCPYAIYHYNTIGHASQVMNSKDGFLIDNSMLNCFRQKLARPDEMIRSPWIRPEDLPHYEEIGIDYFKIAGRSRDTQYIMTTTQAYKEKSYSGNLLDLLEVVSKKISAPEHFLFTRFVKFNPKAAGKILTLLSNLARHAEPLGKANLLEFGARIDPEFLRLLVDAFYDLARTMNRMAIPNDRLDGFIEHFKEHSCEISCEECGYCEEWANKVVEMNPDEVRRCVERLESVLGRLARSEIFSHDRSG